MDFTTDKDAAYEAAMDQNRVVTGNLVCVTPAPPLRTVLVQIYFNGVEMEFPCTSEDFYEVVEELMGFLISKDAL